MMAADDAVVLKDLQKLVSSRALSDVTLVCGDTRISTYRWLLAARSDVFLAMFQKDLKEARTAEVVIDNFAPEVVETFLDYLLTNKVRAWSLSTHAHPLFSMAHQYQIKTLENTCMTYLLDHVGIGSGGGGGGNPENWFKSLYLAEEYDLEALFQAVAVELVRTKGEGITASDEWRQLEKDKPEIITKLLISKVLAAPAAPAPSSQQTASSSPPSHGGRKIANTTSPQDFGRRFRDPLDPFDDEV